MSTRAGIYDAITIDEGVVTVHTSQADSRKAIKLFAARISFQAGEIKIIFITIARVISAKSIY